MGEWGVIYKTIRRCKVGKMEINFVKFMGLVPDKNFDKIHNSVCQIKGQRHYVSAFKTF